MQRFFVRLLKPRMRSVSFHDDNNHVKKGSKHLSPMMRRTSVHMMRRTSVHDYPRQTSQGRSARRSVLITQEMRKKRVLHVTHLQRAKIYLEEKTWGIKPLPEKCQAFIA